MPTTVHVPPALLKQVDRRAKALRVSRNRVIVDALTREVSAPPGWSPGFMDRLQQVDPDVAGAVDELRTAVIRGRRSKRPHAL
jgi:hypothetical protein